MIMLIDFYSQTYHDTPRDTYPYTKLCPLNSLTYIMLSYFFTSPENTPVLRPFIQNFYDDKTAVRFEYCVFHY